MAEQTERPSRGNGSPEAKAAAGTPGAGASKRGFPWAIMGAALVGALGLALALRLVGPVRAEARARSGSPDDVRRSAREREIARMVSTLGEVRAATVLIGESGVGGKASVTLEMREGCALSAEKASAVAGLVAAAAPGVAPEDVVVVDSGDAARTHRLSDTSGVASEGAAVLRLRHEVESALADKLRVLFTGMGIDCVAVVSAEIDLNRVKEHLIEVDPKGTGGVVVRDERGYPAPQGAPGPAATEEGAVPASEMRRTEIDVSRLTQEVTKAVGRLANVRASVVLFDRKTQKRDGTWEYTSVEKDLANYKSLAVRALGLEDYDKDAVEVQYMPSARATPAMEEAPMIGAGALTLALGAAATALALAALAGLAYALARIRRGRAAPKAEAEAAAPESAEEVPAVERLRTDVSRTAAADVGRAAAILRRWIAREG